MRINMNGLEPEMIKDKREKNEERKDIIKKREEEI